MISRFMGGAKSLAHSKKGFGVEDSPFMILAAVIVIMLVAWIGINTMASFVEGNEYQAAVEAATDIYKRAKLLSLAYDGSSDSISVTIPEGYSVMIDGSIVSMRNGTELSEPMEIRGVLMRSEEPEIPPGDHNIHLLYQNGDIVLSW